MTSFCINQLCQKFHFKYLITIQAINEVFDKDFFFLTKSLYFHRHHPSIRTIPSSEAQKPRVAGDNCIRMHGSSLLPGITRLCDFCNNVLTGIEWSQQALTPRREDCQPQYVHKPKA